MSAHFLSSPHIYHPVSPEIWQPLLDELMFVQEPVGPSGSETSLSGTLVNPCFNLKSELHYFWNYRSIYLSAKLINSRDKHQSEHFPIEEAEELLQRPGYLTFNFSGHTPDQVRRVAMPLVQAAYKEGYILENKDVLPTQIEMSVVGYTDPILTITSQEVVFRKDGSTGGSFLDRFLPLAESFGLKRKKLNQ